MAKVLILLPHHDYDPTECVVPWDYLIERGHEVHFATPDGKVASADPRMLSGKGLGPFARMLAAGNRICQLYEKLKNYPQYQNPHRYDEIGENDFHGFIFPGGHAPGMKPYLESKILQELIGRAFVNNKSVGAICHGVLLVARSQRNGKSVLYGRKTTALLKSMEIAAWLLTCAWLGRYYRTYPMTVEAEVRSALKSDQDFLTGPPGLLRDQSDALDRGFIVKDRNFISARWPGDAHRFAFEFERML